MRLPNVFRNLSNEIDMLKLRHSIYNKGKDKQTMDFV